MDAYFPHSLLGFKWLRNPSLLIKSINQHFDRNTCQMTHALCGQLHYFGKCDPGACILRGWTRPLALRNMILWRSSQRMACAKLTSIHWFQPNLTRPTLPWSPSLRESVIIAIYSTWIYHYNYLLNVNLSLYWSTLRQSVNITIYSTWICHYSKLIYVNLSLYWSTLRESVIIAIYSTWICHYSDLLNVNLSL